LRTGQKHLCLLFLSHLLGTRHGKVKKEIPAVDIPVRTPAVLTAVAIGERSRRNNSVTGLTHSHGTARHGSVYFTLAFSEYTGKENQCGARRKRGRMGSWTTSFFTHNP
jgi:hypothetical protein